MISDNVSDLQQHNKYYKNKKNKTKFDCRHKKKEEYLSYQLLKTI